MSEINNQISESQIWKGWIQGDEIALDFENPDEKIVNLCIQEVQKRLNFIENQKKSTYVAKHKVKNPYLSEEIELCFVIARYLIAYEKKSKAPGIKYTLDKIAMILHEEEKTLSEGTRQRREVQEIVAKTRENKLLDEFFISYVFKS